MVGADVHARRHVAHGDDSLILRRAAVVVVVDRQGDRVHAVVGVSVSGCGQGGGDAIAKVPQVGKGVRRAGVGDRGAERHLAALVCPLVGADVHARRHVAHGDGGCDNDTHRAVVVLHPQRRPVHIVVRVGMACNLIRRVHVERHIIVVKVPLVGQWVVIDVGTGAREGDGAALVAVVRTTGNLGGGGHVVDRDRSRAGDTVGRGLHGVGVDTFDVASGKVGSELPAGRDVTAAIDHHPGVGEASSDGIVIGIVALRGKLSRLAGVQRHRSG